MSFGFNKGSARSIIYFASQILVQYEEREFNAISSFLEYLAYWFGNDGQLESNNLELTLFGFLQLELTTTCLERCE